LPTAAPPPQTPPVTTRPETRSAKSGGILIAYQVFGEGRLDLVFVAEFWNSIEHAVVRS
jgi:hypothetical protein